MTDKLTLVIVAMPLLGIGCAVQDKLLKAIVAGMLPKGRRTFTFGLFYAACDCGWLIGSVPLGLLCDRSRITIVVVAVLAQLASMPMFVIAHRRKSAP